MRKLLLILRGTLLAGALLALASLDTPKKSQALASGEICSLKDGSDTLYLDAEVSHEAEDLFVTCGGFL